MSKIELKSCPFCGGKAHIDSWVTVNKWYVYCEKCGTIGHDATERKDAIDAWNRREKE